MINPYDMPLDDYEREMLTEFEAGNFQSVPDLEARKAELVEAARNTSKKTRNINIRMTERDLTRLKVKALEEGIPYQTLASSILHKATAR